MTAPETRKPSTTPSHNPLGALPKLGIGVLYNPALPAFLRSDLDSVDYVEVIPDTFWTDHGAGKSPRYARIESSIDFLDWLVERRPIIVHSIGLSIGSADLFDTEHVEQIARWCQRYNFPWHSDHLSFARISGADGHDHNAGLALPVPYDEEVLDMIAERVAYVQRAVPTTFIIENNVYYVDIPGQDMTEPQFLNRLTARTGCGLLLDVHNVYVNARNHGFDPVSFLDQLDLTHVVEVHIAGGSEFAGMYTDSHAGPCPEPVWELLERVSAKAPSLCAITFEFHESYYPLLKADGIRAQLQRARDVWARHH
jgi:uncharacterized protein (UPF0276 family)